MYTDHWHQTLFKQAHDNVLQSKQESIGIKYWTLELSLTLMNTPNSSLAINCSLKRI